MSTTVGAVLGVGIWLLAIAVGLPWPEPSGGWLLWHAHGLVVGVGLASVAGFLLTAVPEFTGCAPLPATALRRLFGAWLLARACHLASGWWPMPLLLAMVLADAWVLWRLLCFAAPPLWQDPQRRHTAFIPTLAALGVAQVGASTALLTEGDVLRWVWLAMGVLMALIVIALSRISMRMVNDALAAQGSDDASYLARPPRRNLAVFCIGLHSAVAWAWPHASATGWLAMAAAAAVFNLLNDWHVRGALRSRWVWPLYGVYAFMGLGYAALGTGQLWAWCGPSLGHHLLLVGALGLALWMVMVIAGHFHSGRTLPTGRWVSLGASLLVVAALARALAAWPSLAAGATHGWWLAGTAWVAAWTLYAWRAWPTLAAPRPDGRQGCDEALENGCEG